MAKVISTLITHELAVKTIKEIFGKQIRLIGTFTGRTEVHTFKCKTHGTFEEKYSNLIQRGNRSVKSTYATPGCKQCTAKEGGIREH
jgi:hypothetical protein